MIRFLLMMVVCLLVPACSNQQVYSGLQGVETSRCVNGPANDYQDCLQRNSMEYEEYAALREADEESP
jgi:hypothetical protein